MATLDDLKMLFAEFPHEAISWRAQSIKQDGTAAMALAYINARDVMDRLDQIVGPDNWQDRYEFHGPRAICYLSIRVGDEWITKADGAGDSDVEAEKGAISDALKRAAVKWGIGRYLYSLHAPWVPCESYEKGGKRYWKKWKGDPWAFVKGHKPAPILATPHDPVTGEVAPPAPDETYAPPPRRKSGLPETGWREDGSRTSYSLKQSGSWEKLMLKISVALGDCKTRVTLDQLRSDIWKDAHAENWNGSYFNALKAEFDQHYARVDAEQESQFDAETEAAALDQRAREERNYLAGHPLNGG